MGGNDTKNNFCTTLLENIVDAREADQNSRFVFGMWTIRYLNNKCLDVNVRCDSCQGSRHDMPPNLPIIWWCIPPWNRINHRLPLILCCLLDLGFEFETRRFFGCHVFGKSTNYRSCDGHVHRWVRDFLWLWYKQLEFGILKILTSNTWHFRDQKPHRCFTDAQIRVESRMSHK